MIETTRTIIREFELSDAADVLLFSNNTDVTKYTGDTGKINSLNDAKNVITNVWHKEYDLYGYGRWAVVDIATNKVIGFCGFKYIGNIGMPDIGYRFLPEFWGKGYATETAIACVTYFRQVLGLSDFFGDVMEQNKASIKVLHKLGLKFNGFIKEGELTFMRFTQTTPTLRNVNQFYK